MLIPWECLHLTFLLCFTRFERTSGQQRWFPGSARIWCFSLVLHTLERYQHNTFDSLGMPVFDASLVFYKLRQDISTNKLIPQECLNLMFLLCFTRFGRISAQQFSFPGHARICSLVFHMLWEDIRTIALIPQSARIWQFSCVSFVFQVPRLRLACFSSFFGHLGRLWDIASRRVLAEGPGRRWTTPPRQKVDAFSPAEGGRSFEAALS